MASSKRKKEKKQDFQKAKLKVGKAKAKADNFTDTSFKAKSLVLGRQSVVAPRESQGDGSGSARFAHHVSLLRHRSDTQRQESLAYLTSAIASQPSSTALPQPVATLLPKLLPLVLDGSPAVRTQLLKLLKVLPQAELPSHADQLVLYARAGMTHLSADIRLFSMDVMEWLVTVAPHDTVACAGSWVKTLRCFMGLLGWQQQQQQQPQQRQQQAASGNGWTAAPKSSASRPGTEVKAHVKYTTTLAAFIRAGLVAVVIKPLPQTAPGMPLRWSPQLGLPQRSRAFAHLNLFDSPSSNDGEMLEDREDRQDVFAREFESATRKGIEDLKREGGELGRASAALQRAVDAGMHDYEGHD